MTRVKRLICDKEGMEKVMEGRGERKKNSGSIDGEEKIENSPHLTSPHLTSPHLTSPHYRSMIDRDFLET